MTRRNHTPIRLVNQITNLPRYLLPGGSASAKFRIHRVGELLERRKMKVGLGQLLGFRRAAEAFLPLPPFDPAGLVSEFRRDADVMMLALRSEEHTSELQSQSNLVCRLLLEKKKKKKKKTQLIQHE